MALVDLLHPKEALPNDFPLVLVSYRWGTKETYLQNKSVNSIYSIAIEH